MNPTNMKGEKGEIIIDTRIVKYDEDNYSRIDTIQYEIETQFKISDLDSKIQDIQSQKENLIKNAELIKI